MGSYRCCDDDFRETSVGFSGVIFAMLAVAIVYVLATSYVSMLARRKNSLCLLALGWRTKDLLKIVLIEAAILAGFVSTIALIVEGIFSYVRSEAMNGWSLLWIALFSLVIYLAGATWSAWTIVASHRTKRSRPVNTRKQLVSD